MWPSMPLETRLWMLSFMVSAEKIWTKVGRKCPIFGKNVDNSVGTGEYLPSH